MTVQMVRLTAKQESVPELEAAVAGMLDGLRREQPPGARYAYCRLPDGVSFLALLELDDGVENPLFAIPECREYRERLPEWVAEPAAPQELDVIADYGLFEPLRTAAA